MLFGYLFHVRTKMRIAARVAGGAILAAPVVFGTEALVRARLQEVTDGVPTRVYAKPVILSEGQRLEPARLMRALERLQYQRVRRKNEVGPGQYYVRSETWTIGRRPIRLYDRVDPGGLVEVRYGYGDRIWTVRDADRDRVASVVLEPEVLAIVGSTEDRVPVPLDHIPQHLVDAVLSVEDRRFFDHYGLDARRIVAAGVANMRAGRIVQGGSTITQQLAKNLFLSPARSPIRKFREAMMAVVLEVRYDKETLLEAYLNEIFFGQDGAHSIHGVGRAAEFYFGKDVSGLTLGESATLAGIIRGPSMYSPRRHPEAARERRDLVLGILRDRDLISEADVERVQAGPVHVVKRSTDGRHGRYFVDHVMDQVAETREGKLEGLTIFSTLDMELQMAAEEAVTKGLERLERENPHLVNAEQPLQAAVVALDPRTGEILAMVGGRDYGASQFNRALYAHRQPGSAFKPVVALAAIADGEFTLASVLGDRPLAVETNAGLWEPANYDGQFHGDVSLREALERSLNVPFARLGMEVGPQRIVDTARKLGLRGDLQAVPSLALGASEVSPIDLTRAFGVLAAGGYRADPSVMLGILDAQGEVVSQLEPNGEQVFDPAEAYVVTSALQGVVERGTGRGVRMYGYRGEVAAKSGTTNAFRDAWFLGYTPTLAIGVWVGYDDGRSIDLSGSRAALPIFSNLLIAAEGRDGRDDFDRPRNVEVVEVNQETGLRAGFGCRGEREVFVRGTAPRERCTMWDRRSSRRNRISSYGSSRIGGGGR